MDTQANAEQEAAAHLGAPLPSATPAGRRKPWVPQPQADAAAPSTRGDRVFKLVTGACALLVLVLIVAIFAELTWSSRLSLERFGWRFLINPEWNPYNENLGAASAIYGTLVSTAIAMILAVPVSIVTALFLVELAPPKLSRVVGTGIELLAAIPSIIYGMWGLFVFAPFMADHIQPALQSTLGEVPLLGVLFQGFPLGMGMLTAGIILAIMILPFITAVTRDVFLMVPPALRESAFGMGSTTWEVVWKVTIRYGFRGIIGASLLGLGRAIGETMAVTFVIGNMHQISASLYDMGTSITATLANEFAEASEPLYMSALIELGLILFVITFLIQLIAQLGLRRVHRAMGGGA